MIPVLMYHHVHPAPLDPPARHPGSYITPEEFAAQLDLLAGWGFTTPTLAEAAAGAVAAGTGAGDTVAAGAGAGGTGAGGTGAGGTGASRPLSRRSVVLTFDDGCRCFAERVVPALVARGQRATVFAVSGELGGSNRWDDAEGERREELMDAGELAAVAAAGMEVGSHGRGHRDGSRLDGDALEAEVAGSRRDLEAALGRAVTTFCYPWGRLSPAAREAVRRAGYAAAVSIHGQSGAAAGDRWGVPRMIVGPGEGRFELWLKAAGLYPAWSRMPRLGLLAALRRRGGAS